MPFPAVNNKLQPGSTHKISEVWVQCMRVCTANPVGRLTAHNSNTPCIRVVETTRQLHHALHYFKLVRRMCAWACCLTAPTAPTAMSPSAGAQPMDRAVPSDSNRNSSSSNISAQEEAAKQVAQSCTSHVQAYGAFHTSTATANTAAAFMRHASRPLLISKHDILSLLLYTAVLLQV